MSEAARVIRRYLDGQGGSTEASVHHLVKVPPQCDGAIPAPACLDRFDRPGGCRGLPSRPAGGRAGRPCYVHRARLGSH